MVFEGLTDRLLLAEIDENVAAVWKTVLNDHAQKLIEKIGQFEVSQKSVRALLNKPPKTLTDRAFATIIRNRVQRGGILAPGASLMKHGENGRGLASRWYPNTLQKRIEGISLRRASITFIEGDGIEWMRRNADQADAVYFIDPPYTVAGRRLYAYSEVDHEELFRIASELRGDFLMTYDDAEPIRDLAARLGFDTHIVAMKNTHHRVMHELLIARSLVWARA